MPVFDSVYLNLTGSDYFIDLESCFLYSTSFGCFSNENLADLNIIMLLIRNHLYIPVLVLIAVVCFVLHYIVNLYARLYQIFQQPFIRCLQWSHGVVFQRKETGFLN